MDGWTVGWIEILMDRKMDVLIYRTVDILIDRKSALLIFRYFSKNV